MAPQKGKQGTKGQKQIVEENKSTLTYYTSMAIISQMSYTVVMAGVYRETYTAFYIFLTICTFGTYFSTIQFMTHMAKASYSETGQLLDGGIDLNMESGISEHLKDLIIVTAAVQLLALFSNYFWLLWLFVPGRAFYLLWINILGPWFFSPAPEVDEKKQKKMERKSKRH